MTVVQEEEHVLIEAREGVLRVLMNRPEKKNALTGAMYRRMADALLQADDDDDIRVILICGAGNAFTSGNDLADFRSVAEGGSRPANPFLPAVSQTRKPIVAAVNGVAVGIGTTMLLHCDLVIAGSEARFQLPFVNLGLCPELGSSFLLPRMMGHQRAAELLLLGEPFGAETARQAGIVNFVCPDEQVQATAWQKALRVAAQPPAALRLTKALMKQGSARMVQEAMEEEIVQFAARLTSPEAREAFQAFAEKRKPDFSRFS